MVFLPTVPPLWPGLFAGQAAAAIANGGAFEQVERLRPLEGENDYLQDKVHQAFDFETFSAIARLLRRS